MNATVIHAGTVQLALMASTDIHANVSQDSLAAIVKLTLTNAHRIHVQIMVFAWI